MLDIEMFTYLNRALESSISPIVVLATNRGLAPIRGSDGIVAPHGIPTDLLDRVLTIHTIPYNAEEIRTIVEKRSILEESPASAKALEKIAQIGVDVSLRYSLQLLSPCKILAQANGRSEIELEDVEEAQDLFWTLRDLLRFLREAKSFDVN